MPLRLALALSLGLAPSILAAETPKAPELAIESYRLPNGLKVVLHRDASVPRVTVCVAYHVGSKNERAGRTGFAHFFEHMMFRGTKNVPNYDIPLQEAGTQTNAFTSEDMTVYFETVPSNYLERALYLEAERLAFLPSALNQGKFDTEREVVKNERRQSYENVPYGLAEETILANVFPKGHPYSWSVIGSMKDLGGATLDDLKRFFAEFYHVGNATLCLAGDFDPAAAKKLIDAYFGSLVAGPAIGEVEPPVAKAVAREIEQADRVQLPRVYWAWPTVDDDHTDAPALDLLANVLVGGDASRLEKALVREKRIATDVDAGSDTKEVAGLFTLQGTAAEGKGLDEIEAALKAEIERLQSQPPTADELARALAKFEKGSYAALTAPLNRAFVLAIGFAQKGDPEHYRRDFERYFRVTPADLKRVAAEYLKPAKVVLRVVPAKEGEKESEAVQAGPNPSDAPESKPVDRTPKGGPDWSKMPEPAEPGPFRAPKVVRRRLSNGLEVWISPWHTLPIVNAQLLLPGGTADDPSGKSGLATLTASLLDQGTKGKTATELAEALESLGVSLGAGAGLDDTTLSFGVIARNLRPTLGLVGEVLTRPRLAAEDFDRERQLQLAELLQGPDNPGWIAQRVFRSLLHGKDHPYGQPADGYEATVKSLALGDVRRFHTAHIVPNGATLIVVGDVEPDALVATLEQALGGWKGGGAGTVKPRPPATIEAEPGVIYLVDKPGAVQSVLSVGRRWVERTDPRYYSTLLGNRILGADFLSRLNQNLREKNGFTYGAGSYFSFRRGGSVWAVGTSVRADATAPALREVIAELDALAGSKPFTAEEIGTARLGESRSFPEGFEAPGSIAAVLAEMARFGLPADYLDTFLDRLQAVTPDEINRAMAEVVAPSGRVTLVVGDRKTIEPALRALGVREVRRLTTDGKPQ